MEIAYRAKALCNRGGATTQQLCAWDAQLFDVSEAFKECIPGFCVQCSDKGLGSACAQGSSGLWGIGWDGRVSAIRLQKGLGVREWPVVIWIGLFQRKLSSLQSWFIHLMNYQIHSWRVCTAAWWTRSPFLDLHLYFKESHWDSLKSMPNWPRNFKNLTCPRFFVSISAGFSLPSMKYSATSPFSSTWRM